MNTGRGANRCGGGGVDADLAYPPGRRARRRFDRRSQKPTRARRSSIRRPFRTHNMPHLPGGGVRQTTSHAPRFRRVVVVAVVATVVFGSVLAATRRAQTMRIRILLYFRYGNDCVFVTSVHNHFHRYKRARAPATIHTHRSVFISLSGTHHYY